MQVPISAIPNQSFSITLDGNLFEIVLRYTNGVMSASMTINGVDTIDNIRCVAGSPLIPSQYEEAGNLLFLTENYQIPIYSQFNISQKLVYFTESEIAAYRVQPVPPVTAAFFNPIADLPLRFSPKNYSEA